ncbi:MAG: class I SAM-dependent methyltransferase [Candidatus Nitrosotenuis sp.]
MVHDKELVYDRLVTNNDWEVSNNPYETNRRIRVIFDKLLAPSELNGKTFLDVGSGGGHFSKVAEGLNAKVFSLDVGFNLLREVAKRCHSQRLIGSVNELPIKKNSFDIVLCTEVIEHTQDPLHAIKELSHITKNDGLLIITTPSRLWNPFVNMVTSLGLRHFEGYENFLWSWEIKKVLQKFGFKIEKLIGFNFCPIFNKRLDILFNLFDRIYGDKIPWLMLNIGVRARKKT